MNDIDFDLARAYAKAQTSEGYVGTVMDNLRRAYLTALEALESEVAGREHDLTARILGPRMPDRHVYEGGVWGDFG